MAETIKRRLFLGAAILPFLIGLSGPTFAATIADLNEELRLAEVRLRVARNRYAKGQIPLRNVQDREREVEAARAALQAAQRGGGTSTSQSSSSNSSSARTASSGNVAALKEELRMAEVRLRVARDRYAKRQIPLSNVKAREREVEAARAALQAAQGGGGTSTKASQDNGSSSNASQVVRVSDSNQLAYALSRARAGTRIILAKNSYSRGNGFVINANGTSTAPIRIEAAGTGGAVIRSRLRLLGTHVHVIGCQLNDAVISVERNDCRVSKCRFTGRNGGVNVGGASNVEIDYNDFSGWAGRCIDFTPLLNGKVGIRPHIHHNYMHSSGGDVAISIGQHTGHHDINIRALVEHNLLKDCRMEQVIRLKSSSNVIQFNTMIDSGGMVNRHGRNNKFIGNWLEGCQGLLISDYSCEARGNRLINCSGGLQVMAGDITPSQVKNQNGGHPHAEKCRVIDNDANFMRIGRTYSWKRTLPAVDTVVSGHRGKIARGSERGTSIISSGAGQAGKMAKKLSRGQVGAS